MAVNFYLEKRTDKRGEAPIRVSVAVRGARFVSSTGIKIDPGKWDATRQQAKRGSSNLKGMTWNKINSMLSAIREHFNVFEGECITEGISPSAERLKREFAGNFGPAASRGSAEEDPVMSFFDCFDLFFSEEGSANQWTEGTKKKLRTLRKHLVDFDGELSFDKLGEKGLRSFIVFLRDELEMRNTTIAKQVNLVKWFLRWATQKGYNGNLDFQSFSPKLKMAERKVVFLEWDELMRVFEYVVPPNGTEVELSDWEGRRYVKTVHDAGAIAKTRDIFCFCCFTSLRYSDAMNLRHSDISGEVMRITTVKTADSLTIELNKYALAVLERYRDKGHGEGMVFPSITNQRMNVYLKDLCELCGINKPVSRTYYRGAQRFDEVSPKFEMIGTHTGRRTFICNALMLGIPAEIVMKWTGHSDYSAMKPYIDVANSAKARAMDLFNRL